MKRAHVQVDGVVQSVGFRPFVYRTAVDLGLRGHVRNLGDAGVRVTLEGSGDRIDDFLHELETEPPPLATVETVAVETKDVDECSYESFSIADSEDRGTGSGTIPPDTAICDACLADVRDPSSRFHNYWATACVDCGPRFTTIEKLPYDREATSMAAFPLCSDCADEYDSPTDRRYHAQAIACPTCGPKLAFQLHKENADPLSLGNPEAVDALPRGASVVDGAGQSLDAAARVLADGGIIAIKGIGGAHLACDATCASAVSTLRDRTGRPSKPFAVMAPSMAHATKIASVSSAERAWLRSARRPIVVLDRCEDTLAPNLAPGLHTVGVMLPYSGLHHLLFERFDEPIVVTSANRSGLPMQSSNRTILKQLWDVADGSLLHERRIVQRCDDSVVKSVGGNQTLLRRSRGYVPLPVTAPTPDETDVLAVGPERNVTAAVLSGDECYLTQHIGSVTDRETFRFLQSAIDHLLELTGQQEPSVVAHDAHPSFRTTEYAAERVANGTADRAVAVQHHHAHAASVLMEHDCQRAVCITADGVGYGPDGTVWGGEVLDATLTDADRIAGLAPVPMPGGDRATEFPVRSLVGLLHGRESIDVRSLVDDLDWVAPNADELRVIEQQLDAGVNTPVTTSAGRFLDAIAALADIRHERTYEGEPAMRLESAATNGTPRDIAVPYTATDGRPVIDTPRVAELLVELRRDGADAAELAATAQRLLADGLAKLALDAAAERGIDAIGFTGGVAYNDAISRHISHRIRDAGMTYLENEAVPPGDGGIAYGQAGVAAATIQTR
ncbi:carbamoyltransferase HypF [Haloplanus salilacus]|uniref:carbamoyltransferase HypF n=1 Tax=Haloplanus salilacus TaxID=2949994 RepID=UPI0030D2857C